MATTLLPPIKDYVPGVAFEGTRDVRVLDRARMLRVVTWLHQLDMPAGGDGMASETLDALRHKPGPLLDLFLTQPRPVRKLVPGPALARRPQGMPCSYS